MIPAKQYLETSFKDLRTVIRDVSSVHLRCRKSGVIFNKLDAVKYQKDVFDFMKPIIECSLRHDRIDSCIK